MATTVLEERTVLLRRGRILEYFTLGWNLFEGLVAVGAGLVAGSISLVGFGIDSFIELASGAAVLWRISVDADVRNRERNETRTLKLLGLCFLALAIYVGYEAARDLWLRRAAEHSIPGILLAALSLVVMPALSGAKQNVGRALRSAALRADAKQSEFCAYLSALLLLGLLFNMLFGFWWADPLAALVMVPIIAREGREALRGNTCSDCQADHLSA
jgi:divalent metal cation (Fe/Co/Zn/Cd) transporter